MNEETIVELSVTEEELKDKYENRFTKEFSGPVYEVHGYHKSEANWTWNIYWVSENIIRFIAVYLTFLDLVLVNRTTQEQLQGGLYRFGQRSRAGCLSGAR